MNSSVVELIELINGHIPDILFMEASNLSVSFQNWRID